MFGECCPSGEPVSLKFDKNISIGAGRAEAETFSQEMLLAMSGHGVILQVSCLQRRCTASVLQQHLGRMRYQRHSNLCALSTRRSACPAFRKLPLTRKSVLETVVERSIMWMRHSSSAVLAAFPTRWHSSAKSCLAACGTLL